MTVADLRERMSHAEYVQWHVYLGRKRQRREMAALKAEHGIR